MDYLIYWLIVFCNLYRRILSNADFLSIRRGPQRRRRDWLCHSWWVFLAHRQCLFTSFPYWELTPLFDSGKPLELKPQDSRSWRFSHRDVLKTWRRSYPRPKICTKPFLQQLHWLPFRQRVEFKLAVLVFKVLYVLPPSFLSDNCQLVMRHQPPTATVFQRPNMCATTYHYTRLGNRAFAATGQRLWKSLPAELQQPDLSLGQFRRARKTHLFCWWLRRLVTFCFMLPCINVLTYLLNVLWDLIVCLTWDQVA